MLVYDKIEPKLILIGKPKKFENSDEDKFITPLYYNGQSFDFTLKNKYVIINKIEENVYNREFITIKSEEYNKIIESIVKELGVVTPIQTDGSFKAYITSNTKINSDSDIRNNSFKACFSLSFPTVYSDKNKKTLQIYVKNLVVIKVIEDELEIDMDKLELAM